jgi:hypothetical protein
MSLVSGLILGLIVALVAIVLGTPVLGETWTDRPEDPGRLWAEAAGCDLTQTDVVMDVEFFDYHVQPGTPIGKDTLQEAVLMISDHLARDGLVFTDAALEEAAVEAASGASPFEVRLPGVAIEVQRFSDGTFLPMGVVSCAR